MLTREDLDNAAQIDFTLKLSSAGLNRLVKDIYDQMPDKPMQLKYAKKLRQTLRIVLINLIEIAKLQRASISYSRNNNSPQYQKSRYSAHNIRKVVDIIADLGMIRDYPGYFVKERRAYSRTSRMEPTVEFAKILGEYGISGGGIVQGKRRDIIILRNPEKENIRYSDNEFTLQAKEDLRKINDLLVNHTIEVGHAPINRKIMHRVYNQDFNQGGRFYGPTWQQLAGKDKPGKPAQRPHLKIDGMPTKELDYSEMHPTMLYGLKGIQVEKSIYQFDGYSNAVRKFLKDVFLILINSNTVGAARKTIQGKINLKELIQPKEITSVPKLIDEFLQAHAQIADLFGNNIGRRLQKYDSDICEAILLHFQTKDIPVLSIHDSFIVQAGRADEIREVMMEKFYEKMGVEIKIKG